MIALWDRQYYSHFTCRETEACTNKLPVEGHTGDMQCSKLSKLDLPAPNPEPHWILVQRNLAWHWIFLPLSVEIGPPRWRWAMSSSRLSLHWLKHHCKFESQEEKLNGESSVGKALAMLVWVLSLVPRTSMVSCANILVLGRLKQDRSLLMSWLVSLAESISSRPVRDPTSRRKQNN